MMMQLRPPRHVWRGVLVVAQVCALSLAAALPAAAAPLGTSDISIAWDGPTTNLDWSGGTYATASGTFFGSPIAVPGDAAHRTAIIRNTGPSSAHATVEIRSATTTNAPDTVDTDLEKIIRLAWDVNGHKGDIDFATARVTDQLFIVEFPLAQGAEFPVTIGYYFPIGATGGRNSGEPSSELNFEVNVTLTGDAAGEVVTGGTALGGPWLWACVVLMLAMGAWAGSRRQARR